MQPFPGGNCASPDKLKCYGSLQLLVQIVQINCVKIFGSFFGKKKCFESQYCNSSHNSDIDAAKRLFK